MSASAPGLRRTVALRPPRDAAAPVLRAAAAVALALLVLVAGAARAQVTDCTRPAAVCERTVAGALPLIADGVPAAVWLWERAMHAIEGRRGPRFAGIAPMGRSCDASGRDPAPPSSGTIDGDDACSHGTEPDPSRAGRRRHGCTRAPHRRCLRAACAKVIGTGP